MFIRVRWCINGIKSPFLARKKMDTSPLNSPRSKLRAKLQQKEAARASGAGARPKKNKPPPSPTPENTAARLRIFPQWLAEQLVRGFRTVVHNPHPFMLLFRFDMSGDPITEDATALVGSRLDVLLVKINGGIYYESSTHMDGLQNRISAARNLRVTPAQLLYVCNPQTHIKQANADITSDISQLEYVAEGIPAAFAREGRAWDIPLDPTRHLPHIQTVDELPV